MNEWQAREHMIERVAVPGFLRGRRFWSPDTHPSYFMFYETENVDVLSSEAYLQRLNNPTEWSRRCTPGLLNMKRTACGLVATAGEMDGGLVCTLEIKPDTAHASGLRSWLANEAVPKLTEQPGVFSAHLFESDDRASRIETVEKRLRSTPDAIADWVLVLEGREANLILNAAAVVLPPQIVLAHGAVAVDKLNVFQLAFAVSCH